MTSFLLLHMLSALVSVCREEVWKEEVTVFYQATNRTSLSLLPPASSPSLYDGVGRVTWRILCRRQQLGWRSLGVLVTQFQSILSCITGDQKDVASILCSLKYLVTVERSLFLSLLN